MAFPTGWGKKHKITIDNTKVGGSADHSNIPILLTEANFLTDAFDNSDNGGGDLRFSTDEAGNTQLSCEIVTWDNGATDKAEIYVKIPTLDYNADTVIYVWYDNTGQVQPAANAAFGSEDVWSNGYVGVWHLNEASGSRYDSTSNTNTLEDINTVTTMAGKIGTNAADFASANSEYLRITDANQTNLDILGDLTMSCWGNYDATGDYELLNKWHNSDRAYTLHRVSNTFLQFAISDDGTWKGDASACNYESASFSNDTWYYTASTYDASEGDGRLFIDDTNVATNTAMVTSIKNNIYDFRIGVSAEGLHYLDGSIDEARIANVFRVAGWMLTQYNNQNSPSTFATPSAIAVIGGILLGMAMV